MKLLLFVALCLYFGAVASQTDTPLDIYVNTPDPTYQWTLNGTVHGETYTGYVLELTSQTWMTEANSSRPVWKHWLSICVPNQVNSDKAFIYIDGGSNENWKTPSEIDSTILIACVSSQSITAGLNQIPNQPIMFADGVNRVEDALIAYTWRHFINNTDEPIWLARLPMTKAVVRAMDAIQEFGKQVPFQVDGFIIAGASKRGWTTWTTAAVDPRVVACVPIVMPILNMIPNMLNQWRAYGNWSFALNDYTNEGVMSFIDSPQMEALAGVVDPYTYLDRLTMPKYLITSAGDEFFLPDSPQFFFNQLKGEKHLRIVPNAEHSLVGHQTDIILSIVTFLKMFSNNQTRPDFSYQVVYNTNTTATITLTPTPGTPLPTKVKVWDARTESTTRRDFRLITCQDPTKCIQFVIWVPTDVQPNSQGTYSVTLSAPPTGWRGFFLEASYETQNGIDDEYTLKFTSEVAIVPNTLPYPSCAPDCPNTIGQ
ncbi:PhoPQ-activated pathogenicity-related protein [Cavenderia fasciculata]|uniref:PhoPQ-activated pathogenicity-related protein n=1 Tax=Cavenderia fasciculata TaxID=261658 RepID=F4PI13_CACFS|nr:PhoPQ-activated pathogenicity-related protein [Cavenderia fasciculata]EGG24500.1 PhoPQ-activated pathogenicity-related protein [Cavenderia fasciculata]|eukprot:XP_004362351.1 PhoPQ-activated pathogenicity-related protein [Cavenderia fasciculata]